MSDELLMGNDVVEVSAADAVGGARDEAPAATPDDPFRLGPYSGPDYFPAALSVPTMRCPDGRRTALQPVLSPFERQWYSRSLAAFGEPSLSAPGGSSGDAGARTLRFTWLPSFSAPVVVRVETAASGAARLVAKQLSGARFDAPGGVARTVERPLTKAESARLDAAMARTRLFETPANDCMLGLDGSQWIFELSDSRGYHFVQRWTPRKGPARELGLALIAITGWMSSLD